MDHSASFCRRCAQRNLHIGRREIVTMLQNVTPLLQRLATPTNLLFISGNSQLIASQHHLRACGGTQSPQVLVAKSKQSSRFVVMVEFYN
jgi:hypothetical protein